MMRRKKQNSRNGVLLLLLEMLFLVTTTTTTTILFASMAEGFVAPSYNNHAERLNRITTGKSLMIPTTTVAPATTTSITITTNKRTDRKQSSSSVLRHERHNKQFRLYATTALLQPTTLIVRSAAAVLLVVAAAVFTNRTVLSKRSSTTTTNNKETKTHTSSSSSFYSSKLWPFSNPDPEYAEPLPPGSFGCPLFGFNILKGSHRDGPEHFYFQQSQKLGHPKLWKFYFLGQPVINISGASLVKEILGREFDGTVGALPPTKEQLEKRSKRLSLYSIENIAYERDKDKHAFLRRLVGSGIQNSKPMPMLCQAAKECIESMIKKQQQQQQQQQQQFVRMHDYSVDYTLEFVQKKLLGIETDRQKVREALEIWMDGLNSIILAMGIIPPFLLKRFSGPYKAKAFLQEKIEEKIDMLEQTGRPDGSILSSLLFAEDDGDEDRDEGDNQESEVNGRVGKSRKKLTRSQVIGNALFLVAAGAETSASTLTLAILFLGLNPDKYQKLVEEQAKFVTNNSTTTTNNNVVTVTEQQLQESPYLDAIVKETMRIGPVSGTFPRRIRETLIVNGYQIPKGWSIFPGIRLTHQLDPNTWEPNLRHMDPIHGGFQPERWLVPDPNDRPRDFIPFGAGPRYCLGANLALLELKVFLATWARTVPSFTLPKKETKSTPISIKWDKRSIIPRPADGVLLQLSLRDHENTINHSNILAASASASVSKMNNVSVLADASKDSSSSS